MTESEWIDRGFEPGGEPFFLEGGKRGCLLIHGFTGSPEEMRLLGNRLNEAGYTVLGVRLAGHGIHPDAMNAVTWQDWVDSAEEGLRELGRRCDKVFVAGMSMGAVLAIHLAHEHPREIEAFASLSSALYLKDWRVSVFLPIVTRTPLRHLLKSIRKTKRIWEGETWMSYDRFPTLAVANLIALQKKVREEVESVTVPVLVMHSNQDPSIPVANAAIIHSSVRSKVKRKIILDQAVHVISAEGDYDRANAEVVRFFGEFD